MGNLLKEIKIGQVVDNEDTEAFQRVRVVIPNMTEGLDKEMLPWYPLRQTSNNQIDIPPLGSWVLVSFPNKDIYNGLVLGSISSASV